MSGVRRRTMEGHSLLFRILIPLIAMAVLMLGLMVFALVQGGLFSEIQDNAIELLRGQTDNKTRLILDSLETRWTDIESAAAEITAYIEDELKERGASYEDLARSGSLNKHIMDGMAPLLLSRLRSGGTTGFFVVLDGAGRRAESYSGIYLRDMNPGTNRPDNSDVLLVRGSLNTLKNMGFQRDENWQQDFRFANEEEAAFFTRPVQAARIGGGHAADYAVWTGPFMLDSNERTKIMTYSMPLIASDGKVLGVVGVELSSSYLSTLLSSGETGDQSIGYLLAVRRDGNFQKIASGGRGYRLSFRSNQNMLAAESWVNDSTMRVTGSLNQKQLFGIVIGMDGLGNGAAFPGENAWAMIGLETEDDINATTARLIRIVALAGLFAVLVCSVLAMMVGRSITRPIQRLAREIQLSGKRDDLTLTPTEIREIDVLSDAILDMKADVEEVSSRLETILHLTGTSVGVFELRDDSARAFCSPGFYQLFDETPRPTISRAECNAIISRKLTDKVDDGVWRLQTARGERYVRVRRLQQRLGLIGAVIDATEEMKNRYRIEHERDYDMLTDMLNRRAFSRIGGELFSGDRKRLGNAAAVVMLDLDNLKFLNDTYGHDAGDLYIQTFARTSQEIFGGDNFLGARRSGDEFFLLLYGWEDRLALENHIRRCWNELGSRTLTLLDGMEYRLRASAGVAWYPSDALDLDTLIRYADFAMYKVKQGIKGNMEFFCLADYEKDAYMLSAREALNRMVDDGMVRYYFQPIVSARNGTIYGYELLMRPQVDELTNPAAVLRLAKSQSMLHHIERMTWFCALRDARRMKEKGLLLPGQHLFINSIADQVLTRDEEERMWEVYQDLLGDCVMEITESEANDAGYTAHKIDVMRKKHGQVAIDDYGTGYNSELSLLQIECQYVKLDISFVRDVDRDQDKQDMIRNLMSYARNRGTYVLAEGVETESELRVLMDFGVDYLQGYFLGKPNEEPQQVDPRAYAIIQDWHEKHGGHKA